MTTYKINPAHSGTSESEIRKAKRLFLANVKKGKISYSNNIGLVFSDINNQIKVDFIDLNDMELLGTENII